MELIRKEEKDLSSEECAFIKNLDKREWHRPKGKTHLTIRHNHKDDTFHDYVAEFEEDDRKDIHLQAFIYVPEYLMCAYCYPLEVQSENKYPHVTLFLYDKTAAK